jgi:hypothetical protein
MAVSGTISTTTFNTRRVIDQAFRRCRLPAQAISAEMQDYAKDILYLVLSEIANTKAPSWCVEKQIYPLYQGQPQVTLDIGTVDVLNANLRVLQEVTGTVTSLPNSYTVYTENDFDVAPVNTVGIKWSAAAVDVTFAGSSDGITWTTVGTQNFVASAGEWTWVDIIPAQAYSYFRISSVSVISATDVYLGTNPQEIPLGVLNRDSFVAQTNKVYQGRPLTYWYQRDQVNPVMNLWPAPNAAAEYQQLIVWRHRHIMDVGTLAQEIEVPQRWMEAIVSMLAAKVALETPTVDVAVIGMLDQKAAIAYSMALAGDNSGASSYINVGIGCYTR